MKIAHEEEKDPGRKLAVFSLICAAVQVLIVWGLV